MSHCFIAYHSSDRLLAEKVQVTIRNGGIATWIEHRLSPSESWWHTDVDQAIRDSFALVVIVSPASKTNIAVTYSWAFALGAEIPIIPLLVEPVRNHPRFDTVQTFQITPTGQGSWDEVLAYIHSIAPPSAIQEQATPQPDETTDSDTKKRQAEESDRRTGSSVQSSIVASLSGAEHEAVHLTLTESLHHPMRDIRIQASLMLAQFQEVQAVPVLIEALHDSDKDVNQHAAWGLMHIGEPAVPYLVAALCDEQNSVRKDIARVLGQIGIADAVPALISLLDDHVSEVRKTTAEALGQIKDAAAVSSLRRLLRDENEGVRRIAAEALGQIGDFSAAPDLINALQDDQESESVRVVATWSLGQIKDKVAIPVLIDALQGDNVQIRQAATEVLKEVGDISQEPVLTEILHNGDNDVRRAAARVLAHIRGRSRMQKRHGE